jgi:hypothetical protein
MAILVFVSGRVRTGSRFGRSASGGRSNESSFQKMATVNDEADSGQENGHGFSRGREERGVGQVYACWYATRKIPT